MYLRVSKQKLAGGKEIAHLQFAESTWDPVKQRSQVRIVYNFGRAEDPDAIERLRRLAQSIRKRLSPEEIASEDSGWRLVDAWPYGDLYVLEALWRRLGIDQVLNEVLAHRKYDFPVERALFAMVANRSLAPCSKLYCYDQWLQEDVRIDGTESLQLHHLYRAMDVLEANKEAIEESLYYRLADLLNLDVDLVFYDTTSLHFEIDDPDTESAHGNLLAGRKEYPPLRKRGKSKNGRDDAPQLVIGLAVTRDGIPVRHWVFPGNTVDVTTVKQVKAYLRGWRLNRCLFVGDAGMVSADNLKTLSRGGGRYILCTPIHRGGEVAEQVLSRPGRYQAVADNLQVKEVWVGDGERRRRYVVCHDPLEEQRQRQHRDEVLRELEAELKSLRHTDGDQHSKRACQLRASGRYGAYVRFTKTGKAVIDKAAVRARERLDGRFVVHSNDDTLSAEDMALGYKQLQRVEEAWRQLKSGLRLRPVFHWTPHRICAHVSLTVLALILERVAEIACADTWRKIRDDLKQIKLAQLLSENGTVWQVTEPQKNAAKRLKLLGINKPKSIPDAH
ncbi:MAG: IS1634 family transposase [Gammaproteobacteria bacterium]|nr:IS1634 family transposase [Gammaproteobacteria bacterium]